MKKIFSVILLLVLAAGAAGFLYRFNLNRDERLIRKNITALAEVVSRPADESVLVALGRTEKVLALFTPDCRIMLDPPVPEINGREELTAVLMSGNRLPGEIKVEFKDVKVKFGSDRMEAKTIMTALATVPEPEDGRRVTEVREIEMAWKKTGDGWKIAVVKEIEVLY